jgi:hypothetical protein
LRRRDCRSYRTPFCPAAICLGKWSEALSCCPERRWSRYRRDCFRCRCRRAGGGDVVIFKNASGSGTAYTTPLDEQFFDGYDSPGNLFADGFTGDRSGFALVELSEGSSKLVTITTSNSPEFPGSVQWDGTYLTEFDQDTSETYQYTISGTTATLKNTIHFTGASDCAQTWIAKGLLYCGDAGSYDAEVFKYAGGGSAIAVFSGNFDLPLGAVAAKK